MNKKEILKLQVIGFFCIAIIGTLLHFVYEWSNYNVYLSVFVPIDESVWEHLKMGTFATILFMLYEHIKIGSNNNYIISKFLSIFVQILTIIIIFYTYTSIIGKSIVIIDILTFYVAIALGQVVSYKLLTSNLYNKMLNIHFSLAFLLLMYMFFIFTFYKPNLKIFSVSKTINYNIEKGEIYVKSIV